MTHHGTTYVSTLGNAPANTTTFPALKQGGTGMQRISIPPGHLLTPHSHPNSHETTYCLAGEGVVGLVLADATQTEPIGATFQQYALKQEGIVFLPQGCAHYFANTGSDEFILLLTFDNPAFDILTLADVIAQLPNHVVEAAQASEAQAGTSPIVRYTM